MATRRLTAATSAAPAARQEWAARLFVAFLLVALPLAIIAARRPQDGVITLHATMPESGGWQPDHLTVRAGEPLRLRLTSDDVVHSFAVAHSSPVAGHDGPPVDVEPGKVTELTLTFDQPGAYTFYCTRWCGPNHWRMRGTIDVAGDEAGGVTAPAAAPPYVQLGLDIDAPHPAAVAPARTPSASRGTTLNATIPPELKTRETYMTQSPVNVWLSLRDRPALAHLDDGALWDAVAALWRQNTTTEALALGQSLYSQNCAACHGESGAGDGVFARRDSEGAPAMRGHEVEPPTDFTNPALLGASNALLQGKILRGGMGTGMPAWGAIFTDQELQTLLDYLWTFQFPVEGSDDP